MIDVVGTVLEVMVRCICPVCCGDGRTYTGRLIGDYNDTERCPKCLGSGRVIETVYRVD